MDIQIATRLPSGLHKRIERLHAEMSKDMPGLTKATVVRYLIESSLKVEEAKRGLEVIEE